MEASLILVYCGLAILAVIPIVIGSFSSLVDSNDALNSEKEKLSQSDAYMFPVFGSIFLFGFYLLFKYISKDYINYLMTAYFALFGCACLIKLIGRSCSFSNAFTKFIKANFEEFHFNFTKNSKSLLEIKFTYFDVLIVLLCTVFTGHYVWSKHWIANNLFAEGFATTAITMVGLENFSSGFIMLGGLFLYDIFWVFGTNVMVSVAKSLNAPIKLMIPKNIFNPKPDQFGMLGVGDIVVPGIFIALCLKFDLHLHRKKLNDQGLKFPQHKPYFTSAMIAYVIGLITTVTVMHVFKAAQPALLYLSPACSLSVFISALVRGELKEMWTFSSETPTDASKKGTTATTGSAKDTKKQE